MPTYLGVPLSSVGDTFEWVDILGSSVNRFITSSMLRIMLSKLLNCIYCTCQKNKKEPLFDYIFWSHLKLFEYDCTDKINVALCFKIVSETPVMKYLMWFNDSCP